MTAKTKNVQDFSPAATRIYQAARTGVTNRTNSSHVKRIIDKELDKHFLSKEKIKKEISDATATAIGSEVKKAEKFFNDKIEELEEQVVDLKKSLKSEEELQGEKDLQAKISILEKEKETLIDDVKCLLEEKQALTAQLEALQEKEKGKEDTPPAGKPLPKETPPDSDENPDKGAKSDDLTPTPNQEKKPDESKKK